MMTKRFISFLMVVAAALSVAATDLFFIQDFAVLPQETLEVSIMLDNVEQYTAFQADMYLPDGMTAANFHLTDRKASDHNIAASILPDGGIRLMSYSMRVKPYSGNSGALATFQVTTSDSFMTPASITLKNIIFTLTSGAEVTFSDTSCVVPLLGDVNLNGQVSITDVTCLIDLLLNGGDAPVSADVNRDTNISITDVTTLIDRLLKGS
ncbi:MAG: dockerin type I repeat-containing protein [Muribaculaceae bacterium]|nr:dockerin type I repeat-containing protein [Muribaculaceae bacterium]